MHPIYMGPTYLVPVYGDGVCLYLTGASWPIGDTAANYKLSSESFHWFILEPGFSLKLTPSFLGFLCLACGNYPVTVFSFLISFFHTQKKNTDTLSHILSIVHLLICDDYVVDGLKVETK